MIGQTLLTYLLNAALIIPLCDIVFNFANSFQIGKVFLFLVTIWCQTFKSIVVEYFIPNGKLLEVQIIPFDSLTVQNAHQWHDSHRYFDCVPSAHLIHRLNVRTHIAFRMKLSLFLVNPLPAGGSRLNTVKLVRVILIAVLVRCLLTLASATEIDGLICTDRLDLKAEHLVDPCSILTPKTDLTFPHVHWDEVKILRVKLFKSVYRLLHVFLKISEYLSTYWLISEAQFFNKRTVKIH